VISGLKKHRFDRNVIIDPQAEVPSSCTVESGSRIAGKVKLGKKAYIGSNVQIYGPGRLGNGTHVGSNSVVGYPTRAENAPVTRLAGSRKKRGLGKKPFNIQRNVTLRTNCILYSDVRIGDNVDFGHNVLIREHVNVGNNTLIGTNVAIDGHCNIGSNVSIQTGVYISVYCTIKDRVFLGPNCMLLNDKYMKQAKYALRGPTIQEGASIGGNAIIMPRVTIGKGAVVGAGSVVVRNVQPRTVVVGVPAVKLKKAPRSWKITKMSVAKMSTRRSV